jgi:hypothetical protein
MSGFSGLWVPWSRALVSRVARFCGSLRSFDPNRDGMAAVLGSSSFDEPDEVDDGTQPGADRIDDLNRGLHAG